MVLYVIKTGVISDDVDNMADWSDDEVTGTEGNTDGVSIKLTDKQKKESRGIVIGNST